MNGCGPGKARAPGGGGPYPPKGMYTQPSACGGCGGPGIGN